jgi:competence protein ComEA
MALGLIVGSRTPAGPPAPAPRLIVDPNTAPPEVLNALPRLGPTLVRRIVEARDEAPFRSIDDLDARVRGIGPTTLEALRPYLQIQVERSGSGSPPAGAAEVLAPRRTPIDRTPGTDHHG